MPLTSRPAVDCGVRYVSAFCVTVSALLAAAAFLFLTPLLGLCDGIVDLMETGTTLKENGLTVFDTVAKISARVIVNKASFKMKRDEIMTVVNDLERIVKENAEGNRQE